MGFGYKITPYTNFHQNQSVVVKQFFFVVICHGMTSIWNETDMKLACELVYKFPNALQPFRKEIVNDFLYYTSPCREEFISAHKQAEEGVCRIDSSSEYDGFINSQRYFLCNLMCIWKYKRWKKRKCLFRNISIIDCFFIRMLRCLFKHPFT